MDVPTEPLNPQDGTIVRFAILFATPRPVTATVAMCLRGYWHCGIGGQYHARTWSAMFEDAGIDDAEATSTIDIYRPDPHRTTELYHGAFSSW